MGTAIDSAKAVETNSRLVRARHCQNRHGQRRIPTPKCRNGRCGAPPGIFGRASGSSSSRGSWIGRCHFFEGTVDRPSDPRLPQAGQPRLTVVRAGVASGYGWGGSEAARPGPERHPTANDSRGPHRIR